MRTFAATATLALLTAGTAAPAATVFRWVDDQGRVHYSETVPQRYRGSARPVDASSPEPTAAQRREALERAQTEKIRASGAASSSASGSAPGRPAAGAPPASEASRPAGKRPAQVPGEQTDCETWQRLYLESLECFGPFRTVRGGIKPEAFEACNVVPEPPPTRCRPRVP